jgi:hypothetical protein
MKAIYHRVYLAGYSGWHMPRFMRRQIAGTELHRAWLLGSLAYFEEGGTAFGPANPYPPR